MGAGAAGGSIGEVGQRCAQVIRDAKKRAMVRRETIKLNVFE